MDLYVSDDDIDMDIDTSISSGPNILEGGSSRNFTTTTNNNGNNNDTNSAMDISSSVFDSEGSSTHYDPPPAGLTNPLFNSNPANLNGTSVPVGTSTSTTRYDSDRGDDCNNNSLSLLDSNHMEIDAETVHEDQHNESRTLLDPIQSNFGKNITQENDITITNNNQNNNQSVSMPNPVQNVSQILQNQDNQEEVDLIPVITEIGEIANETFSTPQQNADDIIPQGDGTEDPMISPKNGENIKENSLNLSKSSNLSREMSSGINEQGQFISQDNEETNSGIIPPLDTDPVVENGDQDQDQPQQLKVMGKAARLNEQIKECLDLRNSYFQLFPKFDRARAQYTLPQPGPLSLYFHTDSDDDDEEDSPVPKRTNRRAKRLPSETIDETTDQSFDQPGTSSGPGSKKRTKNSQDFGTQSNTTNVPKTTSKSKSSNKTVQTGANTRSSQNNAKTNSKSNAPSSRLRKK